MNVKFQTKVNLILLKRYVWHFCHYFTLAKYLLKAGLPRHSRFLQISLSRQTLESNASNSNWYKLPKRA